MSPIASPTSSKEQENRNGPSNGKRKNLNHLSINKRMESTMQDNEFMVLLSKVEKSSEEFMEIMQNLSSIQVCFFWHIIFHTSVTPLEKE